MNEKETRDTLEQTFRALSLLLKDGVFSYSDVRFLETFLESSLAGTQQLKKRIEKKMQGKS